MSTEIKKLVIDRSCWLRGEGAQTSRLLRPRDGKMCCLGFFGLACGYDREDMIDQRGPANMTDQARWPEWLRAEPAEAPKQDAIALMASNDTPPWTGEKRERVIAEIFALRGVEVEFIDGDSGAPFDPEKPSPADAGSSTP